MTLEQKTDSIEKNLNLPGVKLDAANEDLVFPSDPSSLAPEEVSKHYTKFMSWLGYTEYLASKLEANILMLKAQVKQRVSEVKNESGTAKLPKDYMDSDSTLLQLQISILEEEAVGKILQGKMALYDSCAKALSRELSKRIAFDSKSATPWTGNKGL